MSTEQLDRIERKLDVLLAVLEKLSPLLARFLPKEGHGNTSRKATQFWGQPRR